MTMFLTVWLSAQWPNSWPSTANTSSLLHPILRFLFASPSSFALFDSSSFVSSLVEANLCVSLSLLSSVSSATVDSTGSCNYVRTRTALISGNFLSYGDLRIQHRMSPQNEDGKISWEISITGESTAPTYEQPATKLIIKEEAFYSCKRLSNASELIYLRALVSTKL